jgi:hypothetical protein
MIEAAGAVRVPNGIGAETQSSAGEEDNGGQADKRAAKKGLF